MPRPRRTSRCSAKTYDALKAVDPSRRVWGGALAPRGSDRPERARRRRRPRSSRRMGAAYRASGRTLPVMDGLAFHPYPDNSSQSPDFPHPNVARRSGSRITKARRAPRNGIRRDGAARLVAADPLRRVRDRVDDPARQGEPLQRVPSRRRRCRWTSTSRRRPTTSALRLAFCQPTVAGSSSSTRRTRRRSLSWQSGLYYADGTPKASLRAYGTRSTERAEGRSRSAMGWRSTSALTNVRFPGPKEFAGRQARHAVSVQLDCAWELPATRTTTAPSPRGTRVCPLGPDDVASLTGRRLGGARLCG